MTKNLTILQCTWKWHLVRSWCYAASTSVRFQNISSHWMNTLDSLATSYSCLPPQFLAPAYLLFIFVGSPILDISYNLKGIIYDLLCQTLLSMMFLRFIHVVACVIASLLFTAEYFPLYIRAYRYSPLYDVQPFVYAVHLLMDLWVFSIFWLLWIGLIQTFMYKYLSSCFQFFGVYIYKCTYIRMYMYMTIWSYGNNV